MTIIQEIPELDEAINADAWEYLQDNAPEFADAVRAAVGRNVMPDDVYRYVARRVGQNREALARRCRQAAAHLWAMREEERQQAERRAVKVS